MTTQVTATALTANLGTLMVATSEKLSETSERAVLAFKENQEQQKKTIEVLTKGKADLEAKLLEAQAEIAKVKAATEAKIKALEAELSTKKNRLDHFIEVAEKEMGPVLKHLSGRSTVEGVRHIVSPTTYNVYLEDCNEQNAYMASIETHGLAIKRQIDLLKNP